MTTVIGGPASVELAKKIAKRLDAKYLESESRVFPDGESKLTINGTPRNGKIIIVQSTPPPVDTNMLHALSLISKARKWSNQVVAAIPYLGYMRQDMEFLKGEVVTSRLVADLLGSVGASKIITVDIHSKLALNYFAVKILNLSATEKLAAYLKRINLQNPLVVAPDLFWSNAAKNLARLLGTQSSALNKQRDRKTGKLRIIPSKKEDLSGRDIILFDDMISTGGSIVAAATHLKNQNCGQIYAVCTHALLVGNAEKRIKKAGVKKIISTNTISSKTAEVDVSDVVTRAV
ncbi:MAG TPA: ribose-phosphate diphosphokinase [Candidatus Nitrosotenuis sp.]|nr:ribose-phosphate diphosphokinase [Candidatus Nitrosotenuis sp.]